MPTKEKNHVHNFSLSVRQAVVFKYVNLVSSPKNECTINTERRESRRGSYSFGGWLCAVRARSAMGTERLTSHRCLDGT